MKKLFKGYEIHLYAWLTVLMWGIVPAFAKKALEAVQDVYIVIFYINLAAVIVLGLLYVAVVKKWRSFPAYKGRDILNMAGIGIIWPFFYSIFYFNGIKLTSPAMMTIINYTWPIFLVLLALPILKEKLNQRKKKQIGVLFGSLGVALPYAYLVKIKYEFFPGFSWGLLLLLGLLAAIFQALYLVLDEKYKKKLGKDRGTKENGEIFDTISRVLIYEIITVVGVAIIIAMAPSSHFVLPPRTPLILLLAIGVFANGIGFVTFTRAIKGEKKSEAAIIICFTPIAQLVILLLGKLESFPMIIWIIILIGGGLVASGYRLLRIERAAEEKR